jgi:hypothetical protein
MSSETLPRIDLLNPSKLFILLDEAKHYMTDSEKLLYHCLDRYSLTAQDYQVEHCYLEKPPSKIIDRHALKEARRHQLIDTLSNSERSFVLIAMGKFSCEMLFAKAKASHRYGTCWKVDKDFESVQNIIKGRAWVTYDPTAALYNPNLAVDIAAVIHAAATDANLKPKTNRQIKQFNGWKL